MRPTKPKHCCEKPALQSCRTVAIGVGLQLKLAELERYNGKCKGCCSCCCCCFACSCNCYYNGCPIALLPLPVVVCLSLSLSFSLSLALSLSRLALFHIIVCLWMPSAHSALYAHAKILQQICKCVPRNESWSGISIYYISCSAIF